ncbi:T-box transcription factor TBX5-A [Schistosoma japonicum]|uniref:T-box transcription factor TBX5-A n=1 Tax=Schistosoma japonicum TaxID=6182 RepID=A0A4Z2DT02_SCHJA|nr:T-box transcription factor TBX5-A [Schistosoma japonicum]
MTYKQNIKIRIIIITVIMELHYPSAYSTPTTLNNPQINPNHKTTTVNNTTEQCIPSTNLFDYNLKLISSSSPSSSSSSSLQHQSNVYLKQHQHDINTMLLDEEYETAKQLDTFEISPQFYFSESSSSIEPNNNLLSCNQTTDSLQLTESTTHTDWYSHLSQTTTDVSSYDATLAKTCISPSWKNQEYVHYSYTSSSPDLNSQQQQLQPEQQYQLNEQTTFQGYQDIQSNETKVPLSKYQLFNDFYENVMEYYDPIKMIENTEPIQSTLNSDQYTSSFSIFNQPLYTTDENDLSSYYKHNDNNIDSMKLHHYNEENLSYTTIYDNEQSQLSQMNIVPTINDEQYCCQLCSVEHFNPITSFYTNWNQSMINSPQTIFNNLNDSYHPHHHHHHHQQQQQQQQREQQKLQQQITSSPLNYSQSNQCFNDYPIDYINLHKRKSHKKHSNLIHQYHHHHHDYQLQMKSSSTTTTSSSTSSSSSKNSLNTSKLTSSSSLFHIPLTQLTVLLPIVSCDVISKLLYKCNTLHRIPLFQTIRIDNLLLSTSTNVQLSMVNNQQIYFKLREEKIWSDIYLHNTEMIATNTGRRIFPSLSVDVFGLNPTDDYIFLLDMLLIQPHIFKHQGDRWIVNSQSEVYYIQEESPKSGAYWMESGVNFTRVKITNTKDLKPHKNMIHVNSMHYYIPRISIVRLNHCIGNQSNCYHSISNSLSQSNQLELIGAYIIPGTQFYTVTAYQNPDVIRIKINNNPFAKGFRNRQDTDDFSELAVLSRIFNVQKIFLTTIETFTDGM